MRTEERLASSIAANPASHPVRVAVNGIDASGKTTLADALVQPLCRLGREVIRGSIDGFLHPRSHRYRCGNDSAEGYYYDSFDLDAVVRNVLKPLGPEGNRVYRTRVFDHISDNELHDDARMASNNAILLFDGVFLFRPELDPHWDFRIWVQVSMEEAIGRGVRRDSVALGGEAEARRRYETRYYPGQRLYLHECDPINRVDVIVDNEDPVAPTLVWCKQPLGEGRQ